MSIRVSEFDYLAEILAIDPNGRRLRPEKSSIRRSQHRPALRALGQGSSVGQLYMRGFAEVATKPHLLAVVYERPTGSLLRALLVAAAVAAIAAAVAADDSGSVDHQDDPVTASGLTSPDIALSDLVGLTATMAAAAVGAITFARRGGFHGRVISSAVVVSVLLSIAIGTLSIVFLLRGHADDLLPYSSHLPESVAARQRDSALRALAVLQLVSLAIVAVVRFHRFGKAKGYGRNIDEEWMMVYNGDTKV